MSGSKVVTVALDEADRVWLTKVVASGTHPARMIMRARVLLALDQDAGPVVVARQVGVSETTVRSIIQRFTESGGDVEARLIKLACSSPPEGYSRWSLRLLERHVALSQDLPDLDHSTIGRVLEKRNCVLI